MNSGFTPVTSSAPVAQAAPDNSAEEERLRQEAE